MLTDRRIRHLLPDENEYWFGFEQEYTFVNNERPLGFPENGYPAPKGMYYCAVGKENIAGRDMVEEHLYLCLEAGINVIGINAEVMLGQWECQVFGKGSRQASDDLWVSRYLLFRTAESHGLNIEFAPKPVKGDWNGSGLHTNFSNEIMREKGGEDLFKIILDHLGTVQQDHISVYGSQNHERLTGLHETQSIEKYSYGVSDRGSSIRIPVSTVNNGWKGYAEDRRPASNADPYKITNILIKNIEASLAENAAAD